MKKTALSGYPEKGNLLSPISAIKRNIIAEIVSGALILLFLYTSISKLLKFTTYVKQMQAQPLPNWMSPYLPIIIPAAEIIISIALMYEKTRKAALWASLIMLISFTIYIGAILANSFDKIPCTCGGVIETFTWSQHLIFNLIFILLAVLGILMLKKKRYPESNNL